MSTVAEITEALPGLSDTELRNVEQALHAIYRQRHTGIIFDDAYGVFTEADQAALAAEAFEMMDAPERKAKDRAA
jgi:hypothetical protein